MNKTVIAPIIALVGLLCKLLFNVDLDDNALSTIADGVLAIIVIYGIITNHKKE